VLVHPRFWLEGFVWAATLLAAGAGISRGAAPTSLGAVLAGVALAAARALVAAVGGALAMAEHHAWPDAWTGPAWSAWLEGAGSAAGGGGVVWARALVALVVAALWVTTTIETLASAIGDKWRRGDALWVPATLGIVASVALALPRSLSTPGLDTSAALFGHLLTPWIFGVGLPLGAAAICWLARGEASAIASAVDPLHRFRARVWLPPVVRWVAPALGVAVAVAQTVGAVRGEAPLVVRGLGALDDVAHVVVPVTWALTTFIAATALTWLRPGSELPREGVTA
jgi:hypothetical protein